MKTFSVCVYLTSSIYFVVTYKKYNPASIFLIIKTSFKFIHTLGFDCCLLKAIPGVSIFIGKAELLDIP